MNELKQKRGNAKACITRAVEFVGTIVESVTLEMLEIRLTRLVEAWTEFSSLHYELLKHVESEDDLQNFYKDFGIYETKYFEAHAGLKTVIRQRQLFEKDNSKNQSEILDHVISTQGDIMKALESSNKDSGKIKLPQ